MIHMIYDNSFARKKIPPAAPGAIPAKSLAHIWELVYLYILSNMIKSECFFFLYFKILILSSFI